MSLSRKRLYRLVVQGKVEGTRSRGRHCRLGRPCDGLTKSKSAVDSPLHERNTTSTNREKSRILYLRWFKFPLSSHSGTSPKSRQLYRIACKVCRQRGRHKITRKPEVRQCDGLTKSCLLLIVPCLSATRAQQIESHKVTYQITSANQWTLVDNIVPVLYSKYE